MISVIEGLRELGSTTEPNLPHVMSVPRVVIDLFQQPKTFS
jgi:hypothetical protein